MKVFLSWSGNSSKEYALALKDWLPNVLQFVDPFVSCDDIEKGTRWSTEIAQELSHTSIGIICLTPENINSPWINFEAGALSKTLSNTFVCPILFHLKRAEIQGPLTQFQSTLFEKEDIKKLVKTINSANTESRLDEIRLDRAFDTWWNDIDNRIQSFDKATPENQINATPPDGVPQQQMIEEILELTRMQTRYLTSPENILPPEYLSRFFSPHSLHPNVRKDLEECLDLSESIRHKIYADKLTPDDTMYLCNRIRKPINYLLNKSSSHSSIRRFPRENIVEKEPAED